MCQQYGLYSAFVGALIYVVFGSCKDITIGPTALMALMTHQYVQGRSVDFAILLTFLAGCMQLLMAALRLGMLQ
jgi:sodium-independent sulfate anion transporter 11